MTKRRMGIALLPTARYARDDSDEVSENEPERAGLTRRDQALFVDGVQETLEQSLSFSQAVSTPGGSLYPRRSRR